MPAADGLFRPDGLLPVTPAPVAGEGLLGYVLRVSEANGYASPWQVLALARISQNRMTATTLPAAPLAGILGRSRQELERLPWGRWPDGRALPPLNRGLPTLLRHVDLEHPKICPQCVAERGIVDCTWDLKVMVACPIHRRWLLDRCPACGERLRWFRPGLARCRCGAELGSAHPEEAPARVVELLQVVRSTLYGERSNGDSCGMPVEDLHGLGIEHLLMLLGKIGRFFRDPEEREKTAFVDFTPALVDRIAALFEHWPKGFHEWLRQVDGEVGASAPLGLARRFERLYKRVITPRGIPRERLLFLRRAFVEFAEGRWDDGSDGRSVLGVMELSRRLGVRPITAKRWAEEGLFQLERVAGTPSRQPRYRVPEALPARATKGGLNERQAGKYVGLPVSVLASLRRRGIYRVRHLGVTQVQYHRFDLDEMRAGFLGRAPKSLHRAGPAETTIAELMRRKFRHAEAKAEVLAAIHDGRLVPASRVGNQIGDIVVGLEEAMAVARVSGTEKTLPAYEAAKRLGCDPAAIRALVQAGHLAGEFHGRELRVAVQSLQRFAETYVPVSALAQARKMRPASLGAKLQAAGVALLVLARSDGETLQTLFPLGEKSHSLRGHPIAAIRQAALQDLDALLGTRPPRAHVSAAKRLQLYLAELQTSGQALPRRAGEPNLAAIAKACGFARNAFYHNSQVMRLLGDYDRDESKRSTEAVLTA